MAKTNRFELVGCIDIDSDFYKGFRVEIIYDRKENMLDTWLAHESNGMKTFMGGFKDDGQIISRDLTEDDVWWLEQRAEEFIPGYIEDMDALEEAFIKKLEER